MADTMLDARFCDERDEAGFSWVVVEPMQRTGHALASDGCVWFVDPTDWGPAIERGLSLGQPQAVVQLLDRHRRDCASIAARLDVPHLVVPDSVPHSPFTMIPVVRRRFWRETALWWPSERTLVVAEAVGTNQMFTAGKAPVGVHLLLRLTPPRRALGGYAPEHLLVGHGRGLHGHDTAARLNSALAESRRRLVQVVAGLPFSQRTDLV